MRIMSALFVAVLLAGCSQEFADNKTHERTAYAGLKYEPVTIVGQKWLVMDNKDGKRFILTTGLGAMYGDILREGATYSLAKDRGVELAEFRPAADAYVAGKGCRIVSGRMMQRHQSEFVYAC